MPLRACRVPWARMNLAGARRSTSEVPAGIGARACSAQRMWSAWRALLSGLALVAVVLSCASVAAQTHGATGPPEAPLRAGEAGERVATEVAGVAREDERLTRELLARFSRVDALRNVEVQVNAGVAALGGEVSSEADRQRAQTLAQDLPGIVSVDNRITRDTAIEARLRPALARASDAVEQLAGAAPMIALAALVLWLAFLAGRWLSNREVIRRMVGPQPFVAELVRQSIRLGVFVLGLVWALDLLEATALVGAVLGTAGIVGIALGFALRDVVENHVAGILLGLRQPFAQGDHVVIDGHEGKVAALTTRATTLITLDGNHLRLPNSLVFKGVILNYSRNPARRTVIRVDVGGREDVGKAVRVGCAVLSGFPAAKGQPPPLGRVVEVAETHITLEFSFWFDQRVSGFFRLRSDAILAIRVALDDAGIAIPQTTHRVALSRPIAADAEPRTVQATPMPSTDGETSVEDAVDAHVAREEVLSSRDNLLRKGALRE
jgi:small conductance mechanosensitive channel